MTQGEFTYEIPRAFEELFIPSPYKVYHGGRGSGKSHSFATALVIMASQRPERILCCREFQTSIKESVHQLISDKIQELRLSHWFRISDRAITCPHTGSVFRFVGLRNNPGSVRSFEGVTKVWVEEAQRISKESWRQLLPTVMRRPNSEIWISMNAINEIDPTYQDFIIHKKPRSIVRKVNWDQNPFFPPSLDEQRLHDLEIDPEAYQHIWEGDCVSISDAIIFRNRVSVEYFDTPDDLDRFFFGADFGFANDPSTLIRFFIKDECLYIDYEWFGYHVEIDDHEQWYKTIPGADRWPIKADCARPETISYLSRVFNITAAEKWPGSVEDGLAHMKGFKRIVVHAERCPKIAQEFRLYRYKTDPKTEDVLPIILDAHNHGIDAVRYGLDGYIQTRDSGKQWANWGLRFES